MAFAIGHSLEMKTIATSSPLFPENTERVADDAFAACSRGGTDAQPAHSHATASVITPATSV
jgi:hypothetical protein